MQDNRPLVAVSFGRRSPSVSPPKASPRISRRIARACSRADCVRARLAALFRSCLLWATRACNVASSSPVTASRQATWTSLPAETVKTPPRTAQ